MLQSGSLSEKLLRIEKVAQNRKSCSKVAEQNLSRPSDESLREWFATITIGKVKRGKQLNSLIGIRDSSPVYYNAIGEKN